MAMWNGFADKHKRPRIIRLTDARRKKLVSRCKEMGQEGDALNIWEKVLGKAGELPWMLKKTEGKWNGITFDWLIENGDHWVKLYEGQYGAGDDEASQWE